MAPPRVRPTTPYGEVLRRLRRQHGETIAAMAGRFGMSPSYLVGIEVGDKPPPVGFERQLAEHYQLSEDEVQRLERLSRRRRREIRLRPSDGLEWEVCIALARRLGKRDRRVLERVLALLDDEGREVRT